MGVNDEVISKEQNCGVEEQDTQNQKKEKNELREQKKNTIIMEVK